MKFEWDDAKVRRTVRAELDSQLDREAVRLQNAIKGNIRGRTRSGFLRNSIVIEGTGTPRRVIGTNTVYSPIQEFGGTIRPKKGKYLAVPIGDNVTPRGVARRTTEQAGKLDLIVRKGKAPLLVKRTGGKNARFRLMFVLLRKSTIPARPYMRPAFNQNIGGIQKRLGEAVARGIQKGAQ